MPEKMGYGEGKKGSIIPKVTAPKNAPIVKMGQTEGKKYGQNPHVKKGNK